MDEAISFIIFPSPTIQNYIDFLNDQLTDHEPTQTIYKTLSNKGIELTPMPETLIIGSEQKDSRLGGNPIMYSPDHPFTDDIFPSGNFMRFNIGNDRHVLVSFSIHFNADENCYELRYKSIDNLLPPVGKVGDFSQEDLDLLMDSILANGIDYYLSLIALLTDIYCGALSFIRDVDLKKSNIEEP